MKTNQSLLDNDPEMPKAVAQTFLSALRLALALTFFAALAASAQTVTCTFNLRAGWNSVYLDVNPTNTEVGVVLSGLPLVSVWRHQTRLTSVDFIQDPNEPVWNRDRWLVHVPTNRIESLDNDLFRIQGGHAYLINLQAAATWNVTGAPFFGATPWKSDAYNLRGFPIDPAAPPLFRDFFRTSPAHYTAANGQLQPIYRLNPGGQWERVANTDAVQAGVAYWVFTRGASSFVAPLEVQIDAANALNFGRTLDQAPLRLINHRTAPLTATITESGAPGATALSYALLDSAGRITWPALPSSLSQALSSGQTRTVRMAAQRQNVPANGYASMLDIRDGAGTRFLLPVTIQRYNPTSSTGGLQAASAGAAQQEARSHAGLWMGLITVTHVSESHSGNLITNEVSSQDGSPLEIVRVGVSTNPTPVGATYDLRVLLHVDASGQSRLLHEVIQMWQDGVYDTLPSGDLVESVPGHLVLVTDERLLPQFKGATLRDGAPVGRRLSTVGFDFPTTPDANFLPLSGLFAVDQKVSGSYTLFPDYARNPFKHRYHPDHDNLDARFQDFKREAFEVQRDFEFEFKAQDPDPTAGPRPPDYGYARIAGTFRETVRGLHREPIYVSGVFRLRRLSETSVLNQ